MYDAIVIGAGMSGLMGANILSRTGRRVLVLERQPRIGGMLQGFSRQGVTFNTGLHYVGGLGPGESLEWLFRYHGLLDLPWVRCDAGEEVVLNGTSFLVPCGSDFVAGMARQFPGQEPALRAYEKALRAVCGHIRDLSFDRQPLYGRSAASFLEETVPDPLLRKVLSSMGMRTALRPESLSFYEYAQIHGSFLQSAWRLDGPSSLPAETLAEQIRARGGEIRTGAAVTGIASGRVRTAEECYEAPVILSTLLPSATVALTEDLRDSYRRRVAALETTSGVFTLHLSLDSQRIPYVNHGISLDGKVFIHQGPASQMEIIVPVSDWPAGRGADYEKWKADMAADALDRAETRFPGLRTAVQAQYTSSPLTWERFTGSASAFGVRKDCRSVLTTVLSPRTPVEGLYLAGQSIGLHGLLGVSMGVLAALGTMYGKEMIQNEFAI